ncbi:MATE family efflux transporter [Pyramidobacter sp. SM-530-WT-4B]|uniref:Multidrug export protein MepA n=2 Tax=Pyramidobacter porci TaxID=2605789 RepID=A0A6L5YAS9_9BACT|nr:MATE family efflux transporter [Pyramidobacter sp.]MST55108.1 MATE family efflux transporter [Pyramidobacter porci]
MQNALNPMGSAPIPRLILRFALPATVGVLANALYNIVDRVFIGHYVGAEGLAAISVVFPIILLVVAFSALIGVGTASQISRNLGAQDLERAEIAFGNGLTATAFFLALTVPPLLIWLPEVVRLCGATERIMPLTETYLKITGPAIPFQFFGMVLAAAMRAEGHPRHVMWSMVLGSLLNVVLDWWFIAGLGMGVAGAAWGTAGAQLFALLWLLAFYARRCGALRLTLDRFRPRHAVIAEMCAVGLSPFLINVFFSVMLTAFNLLLGKYGGEMAISAMGIFFGLDSLLFMPVTGIGEGAMPIIGYNYGARNFARLRETVKIALLLSIGYYILSEAAAMLWAEKLASLFTDDNPELIALTARCMRIGYAALPFSGAAIIIGYTLEALGRARASFCFNLIRQLVGIALIVILPRFLGVDGVWITFPAIDLVGGLAAALLLRREARNLHRTKNCGVGIKASAAHTPNP